MPIRRQPSSSARPQALDCAGELASLEWDKVDIGALRVAKQLTHGAWADLKTIKSRRGIDQYAVPVPQQLAEAGENGVAEIALGGIPPPAQFRTRYQQRMPVVAQFASTNSI